MSNSGEPSLAGSLVRPGDAGWDAARQAWNLGVDQRPAAVALVEGGEDVAKVIRYAAANGLRVTAQGTGHGAGPLGSLQDTVLIKTERMRGVTVDAGAATARVEAGVLSAELGDAAQPAGMCSLPGSSPDVGTIGFTLGGGLGWLGRRYGFACNHVRAIELVTAAGEPRTVDAGNDPELFWALRGGGGEHAIVTALHIGLIPLAEVYAGTLILPAEAGAAAIRGYRDWAAGVDENVSSTIRFLRPPPVPDVPEPLRGRPLLTIGVTCIGDRDRGEATVAPLRDLAEPIMDMIGPIPTAALSRINMDPEQPTPGIGHHALLAELPDEAIDAFVGVAGPEAGSSLLLAEMRQLGGAFAREPEDAGALAKLDGAFLLNGIGVPMPPATPEGVGADLDRLVEAMGPWHQDGRYFNFAERPCDVDAILPPETCARLREVKRAWDPDGLIRANHVLAGASA
ncbi:MAG TPA: FAD-binding oxidoreductase [Solirubrobacteraceae bacterium]|nr:FAD-binding oxidoreductase [Solirubrobacteraceae bacterium]